MATAAATPDIAVDAASSDDATASQQPSKKLQRRLAKMQYRAQQKAARVEAVANGDDTSAFRQRKRRSQRDCNRQGLLKQRQLDADGDSVAAAVGTATHATGKQRIKTLVPDITYVPCTSNNCGSNCSACCLRVVAPYIHRYETFVKARWCGRTLGDVLASEFAGLPADYCQRAITCGLVRINGEPKAATYVVRSGDLLVHVVHRHEPLVHLSGGRSSTTSVVHFVGDDVVVVDKPSSVPVHPSGAYLYNSMTQLLQTECALPELYPVHRLDRLTSGLLLFATASAKARTLCNAIATGGVQKHYVARVVGAFPVAPSRTSDSSGMTEPFGCCTDAQAAERFEVSPVEHNGAMYWRVSAPIGCVSAAEHLQGVTYDSSRSSKAAETLMRRLSYDGVHSVVECLPVTGRTHQIRVHLQYVGFPIANDPLYGPDSSADSSAVELEPERVASGRLAAPVDELPPLSPTTATVDTSDDAAQCRAICPACRDGEHTIFSSVQRECFTLWLHSFKYTSDTWTFEVPLPSWASAQSSDKRVVS